MMKDQQAQMAAVQVAIRIRPLTERDRAQPRFANSSSSDVLRAHEKHVQIVSQNKYFTYDHVFSTETRQSEIFAALGQQPVHKFVEGYNVTMLAYGQTSSGKTYTMGTAQHTGIPDPEQEGVVPRAMALLFELLLQQQQQHNMPLGSESPRIQRSLRPVSQIQPQKSTYRYSVKVSFVEIYNEELVDLLNSAHPSEKPPVTIREDTKGHIYWTGVKEMVVNNTDDVLHFLQQGTLNRATGSTDMNDVSSRSHAIFSVTLKQERWVPTSPQSSRAGSPISTKLSQAKQNRLSTPNRPSSTAPSEDGDWIITNSKFHFVDLAGSERLKRTAAEGDRRKEGININAGLLALGNVISALGDPSKRSTHIPYRDSKLTRLLQDSLGGSAMTLMIACVSPAESNLSETLNTLQYANRARNIKNKMEKNEMEEWMTTDNVDMLRNTIAKLKNELRLSKSNGGGANSEHTMTKMNMEHTNNRLLSDFSDDFSSSSSPTNNPDFDDLYHEQHVMIADLQQQVEELQGAAEFIKERNIVVENELVRLHQERKNPEDLDFQHLVEPVIEEYEKSISGLESQLALIRAALSHSDQGYEEQQAKIVQCEIVIESQEKTILELRRRVGKLLERQAKDETYVAELEKKLMTTVEENLQDREMLSDLRGKILKLKEVDENTEHYIHDLEARLTASETERASLKDRLNLLVENSKEESMDIKEEKQQTDNELESLHIKHESSEKEKQRLQDQVTQLLLELKKSQEKEQEQLSSVTNAVSNEGSINSEKDKRIQELELKLAALEHDHQDTLKELDEVLLRYQEVLDHVEEPHIDSNTEQEMQLLRESIQHLEQELDLASKRESILRQMSEEHQESNEVENTLKKLDIADGDEFLDAGAVLEKTSNEHILHSLDALNKQFQTLQSEIYLQHALHFNLEEEDASLADSANTMTDIHARYEAQILYYKRELKNLTNILKDVKRLKSNETKFANGISFSNPEHKIIMKSVVGIDKQLTEQYERLKLEAKRFSNDIIEMTSLNSGLEERMSTLKSEESNPPDAPNNIASPNSTEHSARNSNTAQKDDSSTSSPTVRNSLIQPPSKMGGAFGRKVNDSGLDVASHSDCADLILQHEKNRNALLTRLSIAKQDLRTHKVVIHALENKFKVAEISLGTCRKRIEDNNPPVTDVEIEELLLKMDAMKLQLESTEKKDLQKSFSDNTFSLS